MRGGADAAPTLEPTMTLSQILRSLDNHSMDSKLAPDARRVLRSQAITLRAMNQAPASPAKQQRLQSAIEHAEYLISEWT